MITKQRMQSIQERIKKELEKIEKDENIKIEFTLPSINRRMYSMQMMVRSLDKSDVNDSIDEQISRKLGFTQNVIGMVFEFKNSKFEISELKPRNTKYKVIATEVKSGTSYKFSVSGTKKLLGGDSIINRNKNLDKLID